jgi:hypothetical protein
MRRLLACCHASAAAAAAGVRCTCMPSSVDLSHPATPSGAVSHTHLPYVTMWQGLWHCKEGVVLRLGDAVQHVKLVACKQAQPCT